MERNRIAWKAFVLFVVSSLGGLGAAVGTISSLGGCSVKNAISNLISECGDLSFDDVRHLNVASDDCKSAVDSLLPQAQNNFSSRIIVTGRGKDSSNRPVIYLQGVNASGTGLSSTDFSSAVVKARQGGTETQLNPAEFTATPISTETADTVSMALVTDYSASMSGGDIDDAAEIFDDFLLVYPSTIFEGEVSVFSDNVTVRQTFSEDQNLLHQGVARDDNITRNSTALYDGMGDALTSLTARTRFVRILVVATDGLENASDHFTKQEILDLIESNKVFTVIIGTLFSDVTELKSLAGSRGVFFYAKSYLEAKGQVTNFLGALQNTTKLTLDSTYQNADEIVVEAQGLTTTVDF